LLAKGAGAVGVGAGAVGLGVLGKIIRRRMMLATGGKVSSPLEKNETGRGQKPNLSSGNGDNNSGGGEETTQQRFDFMGDDDMKMI